MLLRYVQQQEKDARIKEKCERFSDITLQQLKVKPAYWSPELEPFIESIARLRYVIKQLTLILLQHTVVAARSF